MKRKILFLLPLLAFALQANAQFLFDTISSKTGPYWNDAIGPIVIGDTLYFMGKNGSGSYELKKTDGSHGGVQRISTIYNGDVITPVSLYEFKGKVIFHGGAFGNNELFVYDPADGSFDLIKDIHPTSGSSIYFYRIDKANNLLYFRASDQQGAGLWKTDGTPSGTQKVHTFYPMVSSTDYDMDANGTYFYYPGKHPQYGYEMIRVKLSDGVSGILRDIQTGNNTDPSYAPKEVYCYGSKVYFSAYVNSSIGREPYLSDGTTLGTRILADVNTTGGIGGSHPRDFVGIRGLVIFTANGEIPGTTTSVGNELFYYDPQSDQYGVLKNIAPNNSSSGAGYFTQLNDTQYLFLAKDTTAGKTDIWITDGTTAGTYKWMDASDHNSINGLTVMLTNWPQDKVIVNTHSGPVRVDYDGSNPDLLFDPSISFQPEIFQMNFAVRFKDDLIMSCGAPAMGAELWRIHEISANLGPDRLICYNEDAMLESGYDSSKVSHTWSTGSHASSIQVSQSGVYWLDLFDKINQSYIGRDSIVITVEARAFDWPEDTAVQLPVTLYQDKNGGSFNWSTASTDSFVVISAVGDYWLEYTSASGCITLDTLEVRLLVTDLDLGPDQVICPDGTTLLESGYDSSQVSHTWSTGSHASSIQVSQPGVFWLELYDIKTNAFIVRDSVAVTVEPPAFNWPTDTTVSLPFILSQVRNGGSFKWSTGSTDSFVIISAEGSYWLEYTSARGCITRDTMQVSKPSSINDPVWFAPHVYPNPVVSGGQVRLVDGNSPVSAYLISADGKRIQLSESRNNSRNYQIPEVNPGIYFLELNGRDGHRTHVRLFIR